MLKTSFKIKTVDNYKISVSAPLCKTFAQFMIILINTVIISFYAPILKIVLIMIIVLMIQVRI